MATKSLVAQTEASACNARDQGSAPKKRSIHALGGGAGCGGGMQADCTGSRKEL